MAAKNVGEVVEENHENNELPVIGESTVKIFTQDVLSKVVNFIKHANSLSITPDNYEYLSSFSLFHEFCSKEGSHVVNNIGNILRHHNVQCGWKNVTDNETVDLEDQFERLVDANDVMLETIGSLLDEAENLKRNTPILPAGLEKAKIATSWNKGKVYKSTSKGGAFKLLVAQNIQRPQLKWSKEIDNSNNLFVPFVKIKHNSLTNDVVEDEHPYKHELSVFEPHEWQFRQTSPLPYLPLESTELHFIDTLEKLDGLIEQLKQVTEIAVDLEHHSYRSFQGFLCLMQISTRSEDFIVDPIALRSVMHRVNVIFSNPNILKVMHGADSDVGWLQRDFGIYIVNMFDTGQAARTLHEERFSLAHLLQKYCEVSAQKQYQLADWRIRPLPKEMTRYAQEDTHYLLYVYDVLRNQLMERGNEMFNLLKSVYDKSTEICRSLYQKPLFEKDSYVATFQKYRGRLNAQQIECFRLVFEWRDKTARQEDESFGYTLPNHMLFQIAENLPKEPQGVIACCNPVPPLVKQRVIDIHRLVMQAREFEPTGDEAHNLLFPDEEDMQVSNTSLKEISDNNLLSGFEIYKINGPKVQLREPMVTIFESLLKHDAGKVREIMKSLKSPFQYLIPNASGKPETTEKEEQPEHIFRPPEKRKAEKPEEEISLREMLPPKKKKKCKINKKTKEKNIEPQQETVYEEKNFEKFIASESSRPLDQYDSQIEEAKFGKVIKTKIHNKAGGRSMTFNK